MSSLVCFDSKGVFGPLMTLVFNAHYYSDRGIIDLVKLVTGRIQLFAHIEPKGEKSFSALVIARNKSKTPMTVLEIIRTVYCQSIHKPYKQLPDDQVKRADAHHEKVLTTIVPRMMQAFQEQIGSVNIPLQDKDEFNEWTAGVLESYMTAEQIQNYCNPQTACAEEIVNQRKMIGGDLYKMALAKQLTEKDLDALLEISKVALKSLQTSDHFSSTLSLTGRYLTLFAMNENPTALGEDILGLLSTAFRAKLFPKDEIKTREA